MGRNHNLKLKEGKKEKDELLSSGIKVGHQIECDGTSSQNFWRRDLLFLRYYCIDCGEMFRTADAKKTHMNESHGNQHVCSQCHQVVPSKGAHVNKVPDKYKEHLSEASPSEDN